MLRFKKTLYLISICMVSLLIVFSCGRNKNFFAPMHDDGVESNDIVLVADGKAALESGDYTRAEKYFGLAKMHNPKNSEALTGYAEAYLKINGFSLGSFMISMLNQVTSEPTSGEEFDFIKPSDWGQSSISELINIFQTVIDTLDPIARGETEGTVSSLDVNVNATVGLFYLLSFASDVQALTADYSLQTLSKTDPDVQALIPAAILDQLPDDEFLWFVNDDGPSLVQPPTSFINSIEIKMTTGLARMRTASSQSTAPELFDQVIDIFAEWETLVTQ